MRVCQPFYLLQVGWVCQPFYLLQVGCWAFIFGEFRAGQIAPIESPTMWVLVKKTCVEPGQAILITSARS